MYLELEIVYLIKLRKILLCNYPYYLLLFLTILLTIYRINIEKKSIYQREDRIIGYLYEMKTDTSKMTLMVGKKEKVLATYYFKNKKEKKLLEQNLSIHDKIKIIGTLERVKTTKENVLFNYEEYLNRRNIFYQFKIDEIFLIRKNQNLYYEIKSKIENRCNNPYVKTFLLGDTSDMDEGTLKNYRNLGISHLFAISGMHIGLLSSVLLKLLKRLKIREEKRYFITSILLFCYLLITGLSPSILRAVLFFVFFSIKKVYYFYVKKVNIFLLVLCISLLINPYYVYHIGFWYSFTISLSLLIISDELSTIKNYMKSLFLVSLISFVVSIPISIYFFNQVNILGIVYNLFYVPFVSFFLFPVAILTFLFPFLHKVLEILVLLLESSSVFLSNIKFSIFVLKSCSILIYLLYLLFIILFFYGFQKRRYRYFLPIILLLFLHYGYPFLDSSDYLLMIDVGQGDSILLHSNNKNILVDTGGIMNYYGEMKNSIAEKTTIPILKKEGIRKIDYLILTHGDYDHLGEATSLIDQFPVDRIFINEGEMNSLERKIIIKHQSVQKLKQNDYLEVGDFKVLSLNTDLGEENDSSLVLYIEIKEKRLLLMGDASIKSEEYILSQYEIEDIDILKCGHHGSKTSSSFEFLEEISPKIALISAGVDNKFHHPHKEVTNRLKKLKVKIYNTQELGNVKINL